MILQALNRYYERKNKEGEALPLEGFENKEIPFILILDRQGTLVQIKDTRESHKLNDKKNILRAKTYCVPQGAKKTSGILANLLWDKAEYVLGISCREGEKSEKVAKRHEAFLALHEERFATHQHIPAVAALLAFLRNDEQKQRINQFPEWEEIVKVNGNLSFQLDGELTIIAEMPEVVALVLMEEEDDGVANRRGICLITGEEAEIARLHPAIKGVCDAQTSGANIISFNLEAFRSYGHEQGYNAPISKPAAFAYTTALNDLLSKDSKQKIQLGDATTIFWASEKNALEDYLGEIMEATPEYANHTIPQLYESIHKGNYPLLDDPIEFYILGLAPNASRLAVRFWHVATVAQVAENIMQYFDDMDICHAPLQRTRVPIFYLLKSIAAQQDSKNIPPNLAGDFSKAILAGLPYPETMFRNALIRNRAEQDVSRERAAIIKAYFIRNQKKEIIVSLNPDEKDIGYNMGRLFAALEKIQAEAMGDVSATIRDRYYGAASSTPASVFPTLMKLKNHHLSKLDNRGRAFNLEKIIGDVISNISLFPSRLSLLEQGMFAIGYYHQRQDFFTKKTTNHEEQVV